MEPTSWKALVERDWSRDQVQVFLSGRGGHNSRVVPETIIFNTVSVGLSAAPFLQGEEGLEILQALVDAAFEYGIVPRHLEDQRSELKATEEHLQDMRKLTFSILEVES